MRCNFAASRFAVGWVAQLARKAPVRHARASRNDVACKTMRREYALKPLLASHNFCPWSDAPVCTMPCLCSKKRASGFASGPFHEEEKWLAVADLHFGFELSQRMAGNLVPLWGMQSIE